MYTLQKLEEVTSGFASKASSNSLTSSGGDILSISAPSIAIGTLTPKNHHIIKKKIQKSSEITEN